MTDAFQPLTADGCILLVLTLDRHGTYSRKRLWENAKAAYKDLGRLSTNLMQKLRRWFKRNGWAPLTNQWVSTVEMHKSGWPHVNFVIWHPELAAWIDEEKRAKMLSERKSEDDARFVSGKLADIVTEAGWGLLSTAERARSREESLGYICKCAGKVEESIGELAKLSQLPTNAPFRFRRLRAGKGFLPARKKSATMTGTLVRRQVSQWGYDVIPVHNVKADSVPPSEECCATEERIWYAELEAEVRCARQVKQFGRAAIEVPPVTHWVNKERLERPISIRKAHRYDSPTDRILGPPSTLHGPAAAPGRCARLAS
jgi:hypothetical protein